jgi:hypothetical protein
MLVVSEGANAEPHWNDTARDLLRGLLVYVAGLPAERRTMAEVRRIVTAPENELADTLADMLADPERGQRLPARAAATHLTGPTVSVALCSPRSCATPLGWMIRASVPPLPGPISVCAISSAGP